LYTRHLARQIQWKERVGVSACGLHQGQPRAYLFPESQWEHNLLPQFRQGVLDHLATHGIERHSFAHHVMSSQAFALNLAAPFFVHPEALLPVLQALLPPGRVAARIDKVEAEVSDPQNRFHEPGQRGANCTSSDLGIWWTDAEDRRNLLLVEVKYTESEFGACKKGNDHGGACATGGPEIIASEGALCPLTGPAYGRTYWTWMRLLNVFRTEVLETSTGCPFRQDGYQLMRNQVLAAVLEQDPGLHRVDFAVMMHDDNETVRTLEVPLAGSTDVLSAWRSVLQDPSRCFALSPRRWLDVASRDPGLAPWAGAMIERYFGEPGPSSVRALVPGHRAALRFLASPKFTEIKAVYDAACGPGAAYFRVVDGVLNAIALHPNAPGYVGYRTSQDDKRYVLRPGMAVPTVEAVAEMVAGFEAWLPTMGRSSTEEQTLIPWLRRALASQLWLPELGPDWVFLNQEWRFIGDDGVGRKSDVLAVHLPSGTLGIVEAKSRPQQLSEAREQVQHYQRYWLRDQEELAPFFTDLLRAMGRLYGNAEAARAEVARAPSVAFFLAPGAAGVSVQRL
jgi:hypothetical protein